MADFKHARLLRQAIVIKKQKSAFPERVLSSDITDAWFWQYDIGRGAVDKYTPAAVLFNFLKSSYEESGALLTDKLLTEEIENDKETDNTEKMELIGFVTDMRLEPVADDELQFLIDDARRHYLSQTVMQVALEGAESADTDPEHSIALMVRKLTNLTASVGRPSEFDNKVIDLTDLAQHIRDKFVERDDEDDSDLPHVPFPFAQWNSRLGGMKPGELWVLAAKYNVGKSFLGHEIGYHSVEQGRTVVFHELEMLYSQIGLRFAARLANVPILKIERGKLTPDEKVLVKACLDEVVESELGENGILMPSGVKTPDMLRREIETRLGTRTPDLIVVDFLTQLVPSHHRSNSKWENIDEVVRELKQDIAMYFQCPVLTMIHLNKREETQFQSVDQKADVVLSLSMAEDAPCLPPGDGEWVGTPGLLECLVTRNRTGPSDITVGVEVEFSTSTVAGIGQIEESSIGRSTAGRG